MRLTLTILAVLLSLLLAAAAADKDDKLTPERRRELEKKATELNKQGEKQYERGNLAKARGLCRQALDMRRALYPKKDFPNGHPDLAESITNVAFLHHAAGEYAKAEALYREALGMWRALYPKDKYPTGHADLADCINRFALLHKDAGEYAKAEPLFREALGMRRALFPKDKYPNGHADLAMSINNLAVLHEAVGEYAKAEPLYRETLAMCRALYPKDKYPNGCPELIMSINNLAHLHESTGEYSKAEPLYWEALGMCRAQYPKDRYPNGHSYLAMSINNVARLHTAAWEPAKSESLHREALGMYRALYPKDKYPNGHPDLSSSIGALALLHYLTGEYAKAEPLFREALGMDRALFPKDEYPNGHRGLAAGIHNLATLHLAAGEYAKAEALCREGLGMCRALFPEDNYPNGHPVLATSINNLAFVHLTVGEDAKAEPLFRETLEMHRQLLLRYADLAAEAESWNYLETQPPIRDALLCASLHLPKASVYEAVWESRAALTRLQERRHRDFMANRDPDTAALANQLRLTRLSLAGLLLKPGRDADAHHKKIEQLTETKEDLEKRIANKLRLATLKPATRATTPKQLRAALPDDAAFVDMYRYTYFRQDPKVKGRKGKKRTDRYVVFIVRKDKPAIRVELKEAKSIDDAWAAWHKAITIAEVSATSATKAERDAANGFADLVWDPIRKQLPDKVKTVYLTPDGKLAQVPWGALPGKKPDTILLDEHAVCLVPHGPWLLERLEEKAEARTGSTLVAYGGVDYDRDPVAVPKPRDDVRGPLLSEKRRIKWSDLPGTAKEQAVVVALAKKVLKEKPVARSGRDANTKQLEQDLPKARYAHIATHGFFADPEFRSALQVDPKLFDYRGFGERRGGARSPLVLSGLVLAGANRQGDEAAPDHGIITAEGLIGLRMEGLELAVLSACETGLGELGGGEGVYGLQRAFHVAGCKNVIASLWKVDDAATQALMTLFYRNLWEKKLDPAEALRQAQLTLYRNPAALEVVKKRGADFTESDLPEVNQDAKRKHAPTAHWAAFTFSGVRQR
jgi:CHAT domain-containing protein